MVAGFEVGYGSCYAEDAVVGSCGEAEAVHVGFHYVAALVGELAVLAGELAGHLCVAVDVGIVHEHFRLDGSCGYDAFADDSTWLGGESLAEFGDGDGCDFDVDVDTVHEWAADIVEVAVDGAWRAGTFNGGVVVVAAGAGVHGCDEHEGGWVFDGGLGTADGDVAFPLPSNPIEQGIGIIHI